jgi:hypothetical protein
MKNTFITKTLIPCLFIVLLYSILIPIVTSIIITPKEVFHTKEKEKITLAGIKFLKEEREKALSVSTINNYKGTDFVTVYDLIHRGYLNDEKFYTKDECNYNLSYVQYEKVESGKYIYQLYMFCNNHLETLTLSN